MEKLIKVEMINAQGKKISKEVPESLLSLYLNSTWKLPEKEQPRIMPKSKEPKFKFKEED